MKLRLSAKKRLRAEVLLKVSKSSISLAKASELLRVSYRQILRIWKRYQSEGTAGLKHGLRDRESNRQIEVGRRERVLELYRAKYGDFGTTLPVGDRDNTTTSSILLAPGDVFLNADFGYQPDAGTFGSIGDTVWFDADADGIYEPNGSDVQALTTADNEYGIAGVTVSLFRDLNGNGVLDSGEPIIATDVTDDNGEYRFDGLTLVI